MTLAQARKHAGFTVEALAALAECSKGHLSEIENGKKTPSLGLARRLKAALPRLDIETLGSPNTADA